VTQSNPTIEHARDESQNDRPGSLHAGKSLHLDRASAEFEKQALPIDKDLVSSR